VSEPPLLYVEDLSVEFKTRDGVVRVLDSVSFDVRRGETVGIVGESGSGKSVTAFSILGILAPSARVTGGRALFDGVDLLAASEKERSRYRGREISVVFQNARTALNPIRPVGRQLADVVLRHGKVPRARASATASWSSWRGCRSLTPPGGITPTPSSSRAACASA